MLALCGTPLAGAQELAFPGGVIWELNFDPPPVQLPAFDDHSVYLVLGDGTVRAVDHANGLTQWSASASSTVRPDSSGQFLTGADGKAAWAIDVASGRLAWHHELPGAASADPVATASGAMFLTDDGELVLLAWDGGGETWKVRLPGRLSAPVAASGDAAWIGLDDGRVLAVKLRDGTIAWTRVVRERILGITPIGDRILVGSADNFLYALKASDGGVAWRWRTGGDVVSLAVADSRRVYFASLDAMLRAVDRRHGDLKWQRPLTSRAVGGPVLADTLVILASVSPELRAFRTKDGGVIATAPVPGRAMHGPFLAPAAGSVPTRLVLLAAGGHLLAIGQTVEPMLVPLDVLPGIKLPPEVLPEIRRQ